MSDQAKNKKGISLSILGVVQVLYTFFFRVPIPSRTKATDV